MNFTNFLARMHSLPAIWTKDHISFKEKICMINIFKPVGRNHDFTSKQQTVAMLNLMSSLPPIKRICLLERTDTQLCQWQCSALLMVDLCWPTHACGAYTRWEQSKNKLLKTQLTTQLICMACSITLRTVSPHNVHSIATPTFSNAELCGVRELIKGHARITAAPQVPDKPYTPAHCSLRSGHPPPVLQSYDLTYHIWSCTATLGQNTQVSRMYSPELLTDPPVNFHEHEESRCRVSHTSVHFLATIDQDQNQTLNPLLSSFWRRLGGSLRHGSLDLNTSTPSPPTG